MYDIVDDDDDQKELTPIPCPECGGAPEECGGTGCSRCGGDGWIEVE